MQIDDKQLREIIEIALDTSVDPGNVDSLTNAIMVQAGLASDRKVEVRHCLQAVQRLAGDLSKIQDRLERVIQDISQRKPLIRFNQLWNYSPSRSLNQQFVVVSDSPDADVPELWYLYSENPPQTAPARSFSNHCRPLVYHTNNPGDCINLIAVWHHSSMHHQTNLRIFSLQELVDLGLLVES